MTKIPTEEMIVFVDGTVGPTNPDVYGAWAYIFRQYGQDQKKDSGIVNSRTVSNNAMHYLSVAKALAAYREMQLSGPLHIVSSSQMLVYQMTGLWSVKTGAYVQVYQTVSELLAQCPFEVHWHWVSANDNYKVVELSTQTLQGLGVTPFEWGTRKPAS